VPTSAWDFFLDRDSGLFEQFVFVEVFDSLAHRLMADVARPGPLGIISRSAEFMYSVRFGANATAPKMPSCRDSLEDGALWVLVALLLLL